MKIRIYTTDACPKCRALKVYLKTLEVQFEIRDMSKHMPYLESFDAWPRDNTAPLLEKIEGKTSTFYDHYDMFDKNGLKKSSIDFIVGAI